MKSILSAAILLLAGPQSLASVDLLTLKKGATVEYIKPAKAFQYFMGPTGGGLHEPGLRFVEVKSGEKFVVKDVSVRNYSETEYLVFSKKKRVIQLDLETLAPENEIQGIERSFRVWIDADPSRSEAQLDYLSLFHKKMDPTWAKSKDGSIVGGNWQISAVQACCEMSGGTNCMLYPRDRKNKIQLASIRELAEIAVEHGAKIIEVKDVTAAPEGFELIQGIDNVSGDEVAFYYSAEKYIPGNDQFSQQWNFSSTTYVKGNTSYAGGYLALDGVTGKLEGLLRALPRTSPGAALCVEK